MKAIYQLIALVGLLLLLIPSFLFYLDSIEEANMKLLMFIGTLLWFAGAIPWLGKKKVNSQ